MAEEESIPPLSDQDGTDTSQSKDVYIPEEPTQDVSMLDIQMPETPESTKGQVSDGDTSRLESPKMVKPVLGKVQAKKRLMAFANKFKVLLKPQVKSNLSQHSTGALKTKDKAAQDDTNVNKSRKKTEEKILAIEEIRREESKSKMLLAEAMAAASMEDEHHGKNISGLLKNTKRMKERNKHEGVNDSRKNKSAMERKYSERSFSRHRHRDKIDRDNANQEVKEANGNSERSIRKSQDEEKHKKDKKRKSDKDKRDRADSSRDKREEGKDKKESDKERKEETKEKRDSTKSKKETVVKDKRNDALEVEADDKDKKDKDKDKWKEREQIKCNSWAELHKSGLTLNDVIQLRKRDSSERAVKNRTAQDFTRHFEQMLMLNNYHMKRQAVIAEGLNGPRKYPPESIKTTKRAKGSQLIYCENPNVSLLLRVSQLLELVTPERRERMRDICEASSSRIYMEDAEDTAQQKRNWYQQINSPKCHKDATKWQVPVQLPKSKWDSEDEEASSNSIMKEEIQKTVHKLHTSLNQQERCSTSSSVTDEDKIGNNIEEVKRNDESSDKTIDNTITNDKVSVSPLLQFTGNEKLASEYEQFMKMVCTDIPLPSVVNVTKEYSPKTIAVKSASPHTYHEFNIESNSAEDNVNIEITLQKFEKTDKFKGSIKDTEEESMDSQVQITESDIQVKRADNNDESEDTKSIPSDWENVRIKVERLSDENTESREVKKKKKQKKVISSSDSSSSTSSSDSDREKKKKKRKKMLSNSSSDSDSTDSSSSSSSDSSSSDEKRKRKRKKKKASKKRKKARRAARTKKKRRRKTSSDSSSSDSDECKKKKRRMKKKKGTKQFDIKSINNGDISTVTSPVISSPSDETKILHSTTAIKKIKEETEDKTRSDQVTRRSVVDINVHGTECRKQRGGRKENESDEDFMEEWEMNSMIPSQQNGDDTSIQDHTDLEKIDGIEKDKHRRKRKHSRDNSEQDKDRSSKVIEEKLHRGKERPDDELETKKKKRKEKDVRTEFLTDWERKSERITQQIMQNEVKLSKKTGKQKKETWGETDFDTLNVPSLTQLEKEQDQKQLLADEWEVDSLEALSDLNLNKSRKSSQNTSKKIGKEVRYDKKTDTYIAIETERAREMKKRQERLCAIRIWEEEQEEGEREEMMLLQEKKKRKRNDWDIEEESFLRKSNEEVGTHKINNIVGIEKDWSKLSNDTSVKEDSNKLAKLEPTASKRTKKSRWDMGSQSEEKPDSKDIWEEYAEWSKMNKCEQQLIKMEKIEARAAEYLDSSVKPDLIEFHHKKSQSRESLESSWTSEEIATKSMQAKKMEDVSMINLISTETDAEQIMSTKNELQNRDQFKDILELDAKFKEKTVELYSPSSPALSQKSQDVEMSNDSNSSNSLTRENRRREIPITTEELSIPTDGIPLQLMKLRDTKHIMNEQILDKVQLGDESSVHKFDIKSSDNLFDDLSSNEPCTEKDNSKDSSKSIRMDIFAEFGSEETCSKQRATIAHTNLKANAKEDEGQTALKLIPKQLLIRRTNEQIKPKRILEAPLQNPEEHAAALLSIQKKLLESHALKDDIKMSSSEEPIDQFKSRYSVPSNSETNKLLDATEFTVAPKSSVMERQSRSPASEKVASVHSEQSESYNKENRNDDVKRYKSTRSPVRERRRSPARRESEKRYSHDYNKDKKDRRSDDTEKSDRRDSRSSKTDSLADSRKKSSPGRGRKKRSGSPYTSWERRERSGSKSPGHSWSRSHSRSPKRKDEANVRNREKKRERYDDERPGRSRTDERREKYSRSPRFSYNEDNFKKHGSSKGNRDDWGRRRHDSLDRDREQDIRSYDSIDMLRDRTVESELYRDNRFHTEGEADRAFWQYEGNNILRDGNESIDSYAVGQDLPVEYDDRAYYREGSLERLQSSPHSSTSRYRRSGQRSSTRRERHSPWEKDKDTLDPDRHLAHRSRNRTPPRSRHSPTRQAERFRRKSRSRSRSWSRSSSRSRSTSRSRPKMRSRSRSNSRSPLNQRSRARSTSLSRLRSPEHGFRSELRSSRSPSPGRGRLNEIGRERKDENENKKLNVCGERGRRIETIVQSGITTGASILDSEMGINNSMDAGVVSFQYSNEIEGGNEYYYTENNLTYPPCIDDSTTSSPKRLSLDDRLEIELGIKKQHNKDSMPSEYSSNFNPNVVVYPSPPPPQQHQMMYRQQPTVLQVGNVLQVVPADFNGVQSTRREVAPPARTASSQVVRVGNVLQVVPTSLDWSADQSSSNAEQSNRVLYPSSTVPAPSPVPSAPISVPVPVPVPLPVPPAVPNVTNNLAPVATMSPVAPLPLSLPVPVPVPVPIPATTPAFPRNEVQPQKTVQPVYNYEAILELRRKEREERKRLRELRKKEKERRKIERTNRRALERLLEKNNMLARQAGDVSLDHHKASTVDPSVLKALREGEEQGENESPSTTPPVKEEEEIAAPVKEDDEDIAADEDEDEDEDEVEVDVEVEAEAEAEAEDDEEEEEEAEDEDEDDDDDEKPPQMISQRTEVENTTDEITSADANKTSTEIETKKEWPELPPPPPKGILVVPGFRRDAIPNGDLDILSDADDDKIDSDKDEDVDKTNECDKDAEPDAKPSKSKLARLLNKVKKNKKSVQFADGIKPGEGTSPSGGEGDMPSPPPPTGISFREGLKDLRKDKIYSSRKSRKLEKRTRPPKTKKKVKVKIIKLKKPRVAPIMDDSDEMDDRSPPPPPPGSPPPPHLWPSYLSVYNTAVRTVEQPHTTTSTLTPVQAPPPPTPLPLLVPPPPLNYTIQPCSKA